jgi:hypothetical protein
MTKKISNLNSLFPLIYFTFFIITAPVKGQDLCPPSFLEGAPLNGAVELYWEEPDSLGGFGQEVFSVCFSTCESAAEGLTIEHIGQDTSGGWFQDSDGEYGCGTDMYACTDGSSDHFSAFASYSDTLVPVNSRMSTDLINLSPYTSATLYFDEYIEFSDYANDSNWVEISTNGTDWIPVYYSNPMELGDGFVANFVDLSDYAGQSIYLGFRFFDSIGYNENWYVDNIRVFGGDGSDFENPCGNLTGYNVFQGTSNVGTSETNSFIATGLTNNVDYCFSVTAVYDEGESVNSASACLAPLDPFQITQSSFRDTLDPVAGEYSVFEFSLINSDTANHDFHFSSDVIIEPTSENTLLSDDFNTGASTNFFDSEGFWSIGTSEAANGLYLSYPEDSDGAFYYYNDGDAYYQTYYEPSSPILQSQAIQYDGSGPVFFMLDMYYPQPYGDCSSGGGYSEDASIVVSSDNGLTWTVVDSTFRTAVHWSGYYAFDNTEANWHSLMYNITPYIQPGIFNVGIHYDDCGGNWSSGIGVDNIHVIQGDNTNWLSWERLSGEIVSGDTMSMSLSMMPQQDQNEYETASLYLEGMTMFQSIDIDMITDPASAGVDQDALPNKYVLYQNYPNPFNPVTTLRYNLPQAQIVNISIYDMMGRKVRSLINRSETAGYKSIQWDATNDFGTLVSAGLYLYRIQAGDFVQIRKMVLLK